MNRDAPMQGPDVRPRPVVLLSAGMGAGHDRVAKELERRLNSRGIPTIEIRFWRLLPAGLGKLIMGFYRWMILRAPWLYELTYRLMLKPSWWSAHASPVAVLAERRLAPWVRKVRPSAMVSTFHLCSQVLGDMRRDGTLKAPAISLVVDFAAHGSWINSHVDLHLCLHPSQASRVKAMGAPRVEVSGPVVLERFHEPRWTSSQARASLGVGDDEKVVLVVAGSWGTGDVTRTAEVIAARGGFAVVVAAGDNHRLLRRLRTLGPRVRAVGWVDDMDRLIAASDVVVENAGGLSAMEAIAMGRPVVSYLPIAGHGRDNVRHMERAGVTLHARSEDELIGAVSRLAVGSLERDRLMAAGQDMFRVDAADRIESVVVPPGPGRTAGRAGARRAAP